MQFAHYQCTCKCETYAVSFADMHSDSAFRVVYYFLTYISRNKLQLLIIKVDIVFNNFVYILYFVCKMTEKYGSLDAYSIQLKISIDGIVSNKLSSFLTLN